MSIVAGTRFRDSQGKNFVVMGVFEKEGEDWIYYREDKGPQVAALACQDYSCLKEAFLQRFSETV